MTLINLSSNFKRTPSAIYPIVSPSVYTRKILFPLLHFRKKRIVFFIGFEKWKEGSSAGKMMRLFSN